MSQATLPGKRPSLPRQVKTKISYAGQTVPEHRPPKRRRMAAPIPAPNGHAFVARLRLPDVRQAVQPNPMQARAQFQGAASQEHITAGTDATVPSCQWCGRNSSEVVFLSTNQIPPACISHMLHQVCRPCVIRQCQVSTRRGHLPICTYCGRGWSFESTALLLEPKEMQTYENRLSHRAIESDPTFRWCAQDKCESGQFFDIEITAKDPKVCCVVCEGVNCFACRDVWHEGITCQEHQDPVKREQRMDEDLQKTLGTMRMAVTKKCPVCGTGVQKTAGCHHMFCVHCGAHFNWDTAVSV